MTDQLVIIRGENGGLLYITIVDPAAPADVLSAYVEADTTIEFKEVAGGTAILTLDSDDFDFNTPVIEWAPTDAQITTLSKSSYIGYVHLKNDGASPALERIAIFYLNIRDA